MFTVLRRHVVLIPILLLGLNACRASDDSDLLVDTASKKSSPSSSSSSSASSKAKTAAEAAMRRDIQLKKDELSLRRQDMNKYNQNLESVKGKISDAETQAAATVPEATPVDVSTTEGAIASGVAAKRAEDAAAAKKAQLYALADQLKVQQAKLEAMIADLEEKTANLENEIVEMTKQLNELSRGKIKPTDVP